MRSRKEVALPRMSVDGMDGMDGMDAMWIPQDKDRLTDLCIRRESFNCNSIALPKSIVGIALRRLLVHSIVVLCCVVPHACICIYRSRIVDIAGLSIFIHSTLNSWHNCENFRVDCYNGTNADSADDQRDEASHLQCAMLKAAMGHR